MNRMLCAAFVVFTSSTAWALTGKLIDNSGNPLEGAAVRLAVGDMHDTTDAAGSFSLNGVSISQNRPESRLRFPEPVLAGNAIHFSATRPHSAEIRFFSLNGALARKSIHHVVHGNHILHLHNHMRELAEGIYIVRFSLGSKHKTFRIRNIAAGAPRGTILHRSLSRHCENSASVQSLAKSAEQKPAVDTLIITKRIDDVVSSRKVLIYDYGDDINTYTDDGKQILIIDPSNDNDGDGLTNYEERYVYFTNAEMADTDGDKFDDFSRIKDSLDPRIASIPEISFAMKKLPVVTASYSVTSGNAVSRDISSGGGYSTSSAFSSIQEVNASASVSLMIGGEYKWGPDGGATVRGELTTTVGAGFSQTWGHEVSESMSRNWSEAVSSARSQDVTIDGGSIAVDVEITNNGTKSITLANPLLRLTTIDYQASTLGTQIGELALDRDDKDLFLEAGKTELCQFKTTLENPAILERVARLSAGMVAQLINIRPKTPAGETDTFMDDVRKRTAEVIVDPGHFSSNPMIKKRIATRTRYNELYTSHLDRYIPITLHEVLLLAGVIPEYGTTEGKHGIVGVDGLKNGDFVTGQWGVVIQSHSDSVTVYSTFADYDPREIRVGVSDAIMVIYSADQDQDRLPDRLEAALGTDPVSTDSDNDSVPDGEEYFGWRRDSDPEDALWQTNPVLSDSDLDGIADYDDPDPLEPAVNPLDSEVLLHSITITPAQGSDWRQVLDEEANDSVFTVSGVMRGYTAFSFAFKHPVLVVRIIREGSTDTLVLTKPTIEDTLAIYSDTVPLALGANEVRVQVVSKNGESTEAFALNGIQRRLARVVDVPGQFTISKPSRDLEHKAMSLYVGFDEIKAVDPLIAEVIILRVRENVYGMTLKGPLDLGEDGSAPRILDIGSVIEKGGWPYTVIARATEGALSTLDTTLERQYRYTYFAYTSHVDEEKRYLTGMDYYATVKTPNREIVLDTVRVRKECLMNWGVLFGWNVKVRFAMSIDGILYIVKKDGQIHDGYFTNVQQGGKVGYSFSDLDITEQETIVFPNGKWADGLSQFARESAGVWYNSAGLPHSIAYDELLYPERYQEPEGWSVTQTVESDKVKNLYRHETIDAAGTHIFNCDLEIHWHYLVGPRTE